MKEIIKETAKELGISAELVEKVVKAYLSYIKLKISKTAYRNLYTFNKVKTNFLLIGFGKFVVKNRSDKRLQNEKRFKST
jgi:nucleoid DNA-binding protein